MDDDEPRKETVEIGSGDFQNNPIYGDAPQSMRSTYVSDQNAAAAQAQSYNYPASGQQQDDGDGDGDENNPFSEEQQQQQEYEYEEEDGGDNEYQGNGYAANEYQQQNQPPPYQQQPPAAPPAYADTANAQNDYNNEPEDVVGQMNAAGGTQQDDDVDYGVTQPKVDEEDAAGGDSENGTGLLGNFFVRNVWMAGSLFFTSMMAMAMFTSNDPLLTSAFATGYGLSAFAAFMLFFGSIAALVFLIMGKLGRPIPAEKIVLWVIIGFYLTGGLFYFFGGCAVAYAWNEFDASYIAGVFFVEQSFVGFHAIFAGLDLFRRKFLNNKKIRVLVYNGLFFFLALVAFFAYAVTSTTFDKLGVDNAGPAWLTLWYFVVGIAQIIFLLIFLIPPVQQLLGKPFVLFIIGCTFAICVVCLLIGYFIITGQFIGLKGRAYFLGVGFFVLSTGTMIAFDMIFDRFIPGYKDGGNSLSDAEARGGAVPTSNPDSPRDDEADQMNTQY